jgi:hypothetical protein
MADELDQIPEELLTEEERKRRSKKLTQDIANKYDPDRLSRIVVGEAGRGEHLDEATRSEMEQRIGGNFGSVRVFRGPFAEAITKQHSADAVTVGATGMILVREGPRSDPRTALGKALLAHELTHVAQAQQGLHFALEGGHSQDAPHEKEAEKAESQAFAASGGHGDKGHGGAGGNPGDLERLVIDKVVEIIEEESRLMRDRLSDSFDE